ncbi:MAG: hypothetical protein ACOYIK_06905 [Coriobacteriales bacterium]|jgi:hypothetical protein
MRAKIGAAILGITLSLVFCFGCSGCAPDIFKSIDSTDQEILDMSDEITERDIATAERIGGTEEIISSLKQGDWSSYNVKEGIREAEAAEDHLSERYGVGFQANKVIQSSGFMVEADTITLTITSGPFEGDTCKCSFYPNGKPQTGEPEWADNYLYVRFHEEYESNAQAAADEAFGDLPENTWVCDIKMDDDPYPEVMNDVNDPEKKVTLAPDVSFADAGPYLDGRIWIDIAAESNLTEEEYKARVDKMVSSLKDRGIYIYWQAHKITKHLDGAEFTIDWATEAIKSGDEEWRLSGLTY